METLLSILVGALFAAGVYAVLRPDLVRVVFGLVLLSNAVNLLLFTAGRIGGGPALVPQGATEPVAPFANPLPQALVLTAIVIGFGLTAFALAMVWRHVRATGRLQSDLGGDYELPRAGAEPSEPEAPEPRRDVAA